MNTPTSPFKERVVKQFDHSFHNSYSLRLSDRERARIKLFISQTLDSYKALIEEGIWRYETRPSDLSKPHTDERYDEDAKNEMAKGLHNLLESL